MTSVSCHKNTAEAKQAGKILTFAKKWWPELLTVGAMATGTYEMGPVGMAFGAAVAGGFGLLLFNKNTKKFRKILMSAAFIMGSLFFIGASLFEGFGPSVEARLNAINTATTQAVIQGGTATVVPCIKDSRLLSFSPSEISLPPVTATCSMGPTGTEMVFVEVRSTPMWGENLLFNPSTLKGGGLFLRLVSRTGKIAVVPVSSYDLYQQRVQQIKGAYL